MRFDEGGIARLVGGHGRTLPRKLHDTGRPHFQKRFIGQVCEAFFESIAPDHYAKSRGQILSGRLNPTQSASLIHWSGMRYGRRNIGSAVASSDTCASGRSRNHRAAVYAKAERIWLPLEVAA
jgi:hypothetical protein